MNGVCEFWVRARTLQKDVPRVPLTHEGGQQRVQVTWSSAIAREGRPLGEVPSLYTRAIPSRFTCPLFSPPRAQEEVRVETSAPQQNKMDKLAEILNSLRNNNSDVEAKLSTFMEEAQNSTNSEEMLGEIVRTIYQKAVSDRSFAFTAAKLCDKMALFMVEGTKFRSLLLNMLQVRSRLPPHNAHTHTHTLTHTYTDAHIHIYTYAHISTHSHTQTHILTYTHP